MKLLVGTGNPGKVREFRELLDGLPVELVTPADIGLDIEVEETGDTLEENALIKARAYADAGGITALADDSGLVRGCARWRARRSQRPLWRAQGQVG